MYFKKGCECQMDYWNELEKNAAVVVHPLKLMVASEIFILQEDIVLKNGQALLKKGIKYFSWPTVHKLIAAGHIPSGWRLPTVKEGKFIRNSYYKTKFNLTVLGLDGYVAPARMPLYNLDLEEKLISRQGELGYYWTSELKSQLYPYIIMNSIYNVRPDGFAYLNYGLPVILVKDI